MDSAQEGRDSDKKVKKLSPLYIPVDVVRKLYKFNTKELLKVLFDHVSFTKSSNVKLDLGKLREHLDKLGAKKNYENVEFFQPESGIIKTSYMSQDIDYGVTIKYPYLEYQNSYKGASVIRPLITEEDYRLFFKTPILLSADWPAYALKCYTDFSQFNMFINGKRENFSLNQFSSPSKTFKVKGVHMLKPSPNEQTR